MLTDFESFQEKQGGLVYTAAFLHFAVNQAY